jgi:hypothetical protein
VQEDEDGLGRILERLENVGKDGHHAVGSRRSP